MGLSPHDMATLSGRTKKWAYRVLREGIIIDGQKLFLPYRKEGKKIVVEHADWQRFYEQWNRIPPQVSERASNNGTTEISESSSENAVTE